MFANPKNLRRFGLYLLNNYKFGNLYTWGEYSMGTGFRVPNDSPTINTPKRVEAFTGNVKKVAMGENHTAVLTDNGELFTFGLGKFGALGHSSIADVISPRKVDFFASKNLQVTNVVCGTNHTLATTSDGQVWSWGFGGNDSSFNIFCESTSALGLPGAKFNRPYPTPVEDLKNQKIRWLSSGDTFAFALTENNDVYSWGNGEDGALGNGSTDFVQTPTLNENFKLLKEKQNLTVEKIKCARHFAVALLSDGNLYSWGRNSGGSLGISKQLGHVTDQLAYLPTPVNNRAFKGERVVDYDVGFNSLVLLTDKGNVFWSGLGLAFQPIKWDLPKDSKITKVMASSDCFGAVDENGQVFMYNEFATPYQFDMVSEFYVAPKELFGNSKVTYSGGKYGIRYAITQK